MSDSFLVSHYLFPTSFVSPFICLPQWAVSCSYFIAISFVIDPYPCSFLPLCLVVVSVVAPAQTPDSNKMKLDDGWPESEERCSEICKSEDGIA